jgi:hypothetical protein
LRKNRKKINEILGYLSIEDKDKFLNDILEAIGKSKNESNFDAIDSCIDDWEDIAELNSIPGFRDRVWARFNKLKDAGLVS